MTDPKPTVWIDGHPQLEAIAAAVWEHCRTEGTSLVVDDPRNIAVAALAAVSAAPTDRAAVLREAAAAVRDGDLGPRGGMSSDYENGWWNSRAAAEERVRRLIDTAPTADQHVRGVQAWMALDLHQALGWPVDHSATIEHQGRKSWGDWWAELLAGVRNVQMIRRYRGELPEPTGDADSLRRMADETPAAVAEPADTGHDDSEATPGPWLVQKICCGHDDGNAEFTTWEEADRFRELYVDSSRIAGHDRSAIVRATAGARQDGARRG